MAIKYGKFFVIQVFAQTPLECVVSVVALKFDMGAKYFFLTSHHFAGASFSCQTFLCGVFCCSLTEYRELERTHKDHLSPTPGIAQDHPKDDWVV